MKNWNGGQKTTSQHVRGPAMTMREEILAEAAQNRGLISIRRPMGRAGEKYRQREQQIQLLVESGEAQWMNRDRTLARLYRPNKR